MILESKRLTFLFWTVSQAVVVQKLFSLFPWRNTASEYDPANQKGGVTNVY